MTILFIICLLFAHFLGDWILQSRSMAINKSKDGSVLFQHILIVSSILLAFSCPFLGLFKALYAVACNAVTHAAIDWWGWSLYKSKFAHLSKEEHFDHYWFYTMIAVDQFLHLAIIFLLFLV